MGKLKHTPNPELARVGLSMQELDGLRTRVGWFETNKYPAKQSKSGKAGPVLPVAYIASIQEFGYGPIPPRSFFRPTIAKEAPNWRALIAQASKGVVTGKRSAFQAMELLGLQAAGDVRAAIAAVSSPPLAAATIRARKARGNSSTKPLSDTRIMMQTLTHITDNGGTK